MPVHSFDYDTDYPGPAIPVVELGIKGGNGQTEIVTAFVDSGADATLIPPSLLRKVEARKLDTRWARNVSGIRYRVSMYRVTLVIGSLDFYGIEAIANNQTNEVIVGRDVLNQLVVTLNGLAGETIVSDS
jgi:predicted aspartyl protease